MPIQGSGTPALYMLGVCACVCVVIDLLWAVCTKSSCMELVLALYRMSGSFVGERISSVLQPRVHVGSL